MIVLYFDTFVLSAVRTTAKFPYLHKGKTILRVRYPHLTQSSVSRKVHTLNITQLLIPTHAHFHWLKFIKNM